MFNPDSGTKNLGRSLHVYLNLAFNLYTTTVEIEIFTI